MLFLVGQDRNLSAILRQPLKFFDQHHQNSTRWSKPFGEKYFCEKGPFFGERGTLVWSVISSKPLGYPSRRLRKHLLLEANHYLKPWENHGNTMGKPTVKNMVLDMASEHEQNLSQSLVVESSFFFFKRHLLAGEKVALAQGKVLITCVEMREEFGPKNVSSKA